MKSNNIIRCALCMAMVSAMSYIMPVKAEAEDNTFKLMTLNVDGLPAKFLIFDLNASGPLMGGSIKISQYIERQECDIVCLQENFNYYEAIDALLYDGYQHDDWSGGVLMAEDRIDLFHLQNHKYPCDGLMTYWKNGTNADNIERVAWEKNFGKFSHSFDDIITKGFRRYELTVAGGEEVVVYDLHMDASDSLDILKGNDLRDREARKAQWEQLRNHVLANLDTRPVIIVGDMNSLYAVDDVKTIFFDAIEATGRATVGDAWVEKVNGGAFESDGIDKIIYVNPADGKQVTPVEVKVDVEGYTYNGKPLGDHYPIIATFSITSGTTSVESVSAADHENEIYDINGRQVTSSGSGISIINRKKVLLP